MAEKKDKGFNDAELQDIMSEIESLEREYEDDKPQATEEVAPTEEVETVVSETTTEDNVVNFTPKAATGDHQVEFHGAGTVNFSLNFEVAGQKAHLDITEQGLAVSLDGMNLTINETDGCTVEMDGGVKFSVPMGQKTSAKKAA